MKADKILRSYRVDNMWYLQVLFVILLLVLLSWCGVQHSFTQQEGLESYQVPLAGAGNLETTTTYYTPVAFCKHKFRY